MSPDLLLNAVRRDMLATTMRGRVPVAISEQRVADALLGADPAAPNFNFSGALQTREHVDVVISCNEVNERHGTGILIKRMFADPSRVISLRANDHYNGEQNWGRLQLVVPSLAGDRATLCRWVLQLTNAYVVDRIFCVPYGEPELQLAIALRQATGAPLCLYVMDDHNIREAMISDSVMSEAINAASVRLAISSDLRDNYELKYSRRFWIAPPTIMHRQEQPSAPVKGTAVVVGNIWGKSWLDALRTTVRSSGLRVTWYSNNPNAPWLGDSVDELHRDGIDILPAIPEADLARILGTFQYAILPSAPALAGAENAGVAGLSLPSRVPFILGATDIPLIALGDTTTCASRFVKHFGVGEACDYDADALRKALAILESNAWREGHAMRLASLRQALDCYDVPEWFRKTTDNGRPLNLQFESLEVIPRLVVQQHIDETPSLGPWLRHMDALRTATGRLKARGFNPSFIVDVGASNGVWSWIVADVFPNAHFVQVEPLRSRYNATSIKNYMSRLAKADVVVAAVGDAPGRAVLHIDNHLYGASLLEEGASSKGPLERYEVPVRTLNDIAEEFRLVGEGLVKLDIQGAEVKALAGGRNFIANSVAVVILEVTIDPKTDSLPSVLSILTLMDSIGFVYYDDAGEWRDPETGMLLQKDIVFVKKTHELAAERRARN